LFSLHNCIFDRKIRVQFPARVLILSAHITRTAPASCGMVTEYLSPVLKWLRPTAASTSSEGYSWCEFLNHGTPLPLPSRENKRK